MLAQILIQLWCVQSTFARASGKISMPFMAPKQLWMKWIFLIKPHLSIDVFQGWFCFNCVTEQEPLLFTLWESYFLSLSATPTLRTGGRLPEWCFCAIVHHISTSQRPLSSSLEDSSGITFPRSLCWTLHPYFCLNRLDQVSLFSTPTAPCLYMPPSCSLSCGTEVMCLPVCLPLFELCWMIACELLEGEEHVFLILYPQCPAGCNTRRCPYTVLNQTDLSITMHWGIC